ncbi:FG-GAP repeat domain-containing protein [Pseudozobellia thermophila]|uniref:Repeat domain-containing protein n=1 Tax=Pseudozobellia thermophila TaxID=192903 RepID=A0A1M6I6E0_9FLAO|nr:VCBS repeat-containing protein [Pseudozobellia thermophila]SHJ29992.1 Repeat domain-containing protein [Pseudozobellia thermophila]
MINISRPLALLSTCLVLLYIAKTRSGGSAVQKTPRFERLPYNNPGLQVDLGVGLWASPLPMDYDGDGDMDLLVSCNDVPFNGLFFFENTGGGPFPVFEPPVRVSDPIRHIQVSYVDGEPRFLEPGKEFLDFKKEFTQRPDSLFDSKAFDKLHNKIRFNQWKYVDYENDGDLDIVVGIQDGEDYGWDNAFNDKGEWTNGPLHGYVYLIENVNGTYRLRDKIEAGGAPIDVYGAPSPNFGDFDNDGDLDIVCGEFLDRFTWFENIGTRERPKYAKGRFLKNSKGIIKMDLEMILPVSVDWDKDGDIDLIVGDEDGRVAWVENTGRTEDHMPVFNTPRYFKQKAEHVKFGALVSPFSTDWDDDGDEDLICGNSAGYIALIENLDGGTTPKWAAPQLLKSNGETIRIQAGENGSIQGPCEAKWGYTTLSVEDWDNDGLKDLIVNSIWGKVIWYKNIGKKGEPRLGQPQPIVVQWNGETPKPEWYWWTPEPNTLATQWRTTPTAIDWNQDGLMDLVMLDQEGYLSFYERYRENQRLLLKPGKRIFHTVNGTYDRKNNFVNSSNGPLRLNEKKYGSSGRRKLAFGDWDGDGDIDILVNGINAALWENVGQTPNQVKLKFNGNLSDTKLAGHSTDPTLVHWNKTQKPDLLLGAEDGYLYYWKND